MLIVNATVVTWGEPCRVLEDHALYIENGKIAAMGTSAELLEQYPGCETG